MSAPQSYCGPGRFDTPHRGGALRIRWKVGRGDTLWRCAAHWLPTLHVILDRRLPLVGKEIGR